MVVEGQTGAVDVLVDLVVPVKELRRAKSRLAPAVADLPGDDASREQAHRALALALARLGRWRTAVYDGSWAEWGAAEECPVVTGPA